jgi:rRNA-processing protein CGR1
MATTSTDAPKVAPETKTMSVAGIRKNGKQWHEPKKAFRRTAGQTSYAKRVARESQTAEVKQIEKEMKQEKEEERQVSGDECESEGNDADNM